MFENLPLELEPEYTTPAINGAVELYRGPMQVEQDGKSYAGEGVIRFEWLPFTRVGVRFMPAETEMGIRIALDPVRLHVPALATSADMRISRFPIVFPGDVPLEGYVHPIDSGDLENCARLRFHVANMPDLIGAPVRTTTDGFVAKRITLQAHDWHVILDATDLAGQLRQELEGSRGHAITNVGTLTRRDDRTFSVTDCEPFLQCVGYFLSFCRGAWTHPILLSAEDNAGTVIGRRWETVENERFKSVHSWLPTTEPISQHLSDTFTGYGNAWFSAVWNDAIRVGTQWYVESSAGAVEKSMIVIQAALELFAWTQLVESDKTMTKADWKDKTNPFSTKLRRLLTSNSVPVSVPAGLSELSLYSSASGLNDGPATITGVRNSLVHPTPAKRKQLNAHPGALIEAWLLGMWYLDLCMLRTCGYTGSYSNRTIRGKWTADAVENVPWA